MDCDTALSFVSDDMTINFEAVVQPADDKAQRNYT